MLTSDNPTGVVMSGSTELLNLKSTLDKITHNNILR